MHQVKLNTIKGSLNLITGCGSGLGRATLQRFLKNDSGPVLCIDKYFEPDYVDKLELNEKQRNKLVIKTHDTFDEKVEESIAHFVNTHGPIDNVINVAGVSLAFLFYSENSKSLYGLEHANNLLKFNTVGTFNMIRLAAKYMIESSLKDDSDKSKTKCIINTSCISTSAPSLGQSFYAASKASLDSMTLCIARELSPFSIRCNTINVGYFDTKLLRSSEERVSNHIASEISLCPKRLGHPDEFAHLVQTIAENQMINGCCIKIDAGAKEAL